MTRKEDIKQSILFGYIKAALTLSKIEYKESGNGYVTSNLVEYSGIFETLYRNVWISIEHQYTGAFCEHYTIFMNGETHNGHKEKTMWGKATYLTTVPIGDAWRVTPCR